MRSFPALDVAWSVPPVPDLIERALAIVDDDAPLGVEERWPGIRLHFKTPDARDSAARRLATMDPTPTCSAVDVPDEDWAERSQASLQSVEVGGVIVSPPWDARGGPGAVSVVIQPSMGFGTGHHASTRLCLTLLVDANPAGLSVLDVGTGSGVLAILAARLGAARVVAIDSDPDALASAAENLALNDATDRVMLRQYTLGDPIQTPGAPYDLVVANLTGALLIRQAETLASLLSAGGRLIASGIELHESDQVTAALLSAGCRVVSHMDEDGWVGFTLTKD